MTAPAAHPSHRRLRGIGATVLIVIALLLAPVAAVGTWARLQLVDTDTFVSTFEPLAHDPDVQDFVADQVVDQVNAQVNIPVAVGGIFDELGESGLPPRAQTAVGALRAPAIAGVEALVQSTADRLVRSQQFAALWEASLRVSHSKMRALLDDSTTFVKLSDDGVVALRLDPFIDAVKKQLTDHGLTFADRIGHTDRSVPIISSDSLALTRTVYRVATIGGFWLPWATLALLVAGVLLAVDRRRALTVAAGAFAVVFALLSAGVWVGRRLFVSAVSPAHAPESVANAVFSQVTEMMSSTISALAVLGVVVAVAAWFHGPARPARAMREVTVAGFDRVRDALDAHGGDTGALGARVDRWRGVLMALTVALAMIALLAFRPVTMSGVAWTFVGLILVAVALELLRRKPSDREPAVAVED